MKYRVLTREELLPLEKEFIDFLVVNGVAADEWQALLEGNKDKANEIVAAFSDVVFESIMRKTQYLDMILKDQVFSFQCLERKLVMVSVATSSDRIDFTKMSIADAVDQNRQFLKIMTQEKPYKEIREREIFDMVQGGCQISDGNLFKQLSLLYAIQNTPAN